MKKRGKKGQVTIFVIIAIILFAALLIIFWPRIKTVFVPYSPNTPLQDCVEKSISPIIKEIEESGGNNGASYLYEGKKIKYLCYTNEYYKTCVIQEPMLRQEIEKEILKKAKNKIVSCVDKMKNEARRSGYEVESDKTKISLNIAPNNIKIMINTNIILRKGNEVKNYKGFVINYKSDLYNLIMLANSILKWEARYGDSDILTYMWYYPDIKIEKYKQDDGTKIYIITNKKLGESFRFATRSRVFPAGYGMS